MTTRSLRPRSVRAITVWPAPRHREVREGAQRFLDRVRDGGFVVGDRLDVDELFGQGHCVGSQVQRHAPIQSAPRIEVREQTVDDA